MEIFSLKENASESFLGCPQFVVFKQVCPWEKGLMPGTPRRKLFTSPHTAQVQSLEECVRACVRACMSYVWRVGAGLYPLLQLQKPPKSKRLRIGKGIPTECATFSNQDSSLNL